MKRLEITPKLRKTIKNSQYTMDQFSKELGFEIRNIYFYNKTIREDHLQKLNHMLGLNLPLKEIKLNYIKNLRKYARPHPIKSVKKGERLAEFIGIMLGDGNIYLNNIHIAFDERDVYYIKYVKNLFEDVFGIKAKEKSSKFNRAYYLYCYNKNIANKLIEFGLKRGNKIKNQLGMPRWIKRNKNYSQKCIKGLIDTDGCIYFCKREKQRYIKFTNHNQTLLNDFKKITKNLGYSFEKSSKTNTCLYRKNEVVKFINDIQPIKSITGVVG